MGDTSTLKNSALGIFSLIASIVGATLSAASFLMYGVLAAASPDGVYDTSAVDVVIALVWLFTVATALAAFGTGVAALFQANRQKILAIIGVVTSAATLVVEMLTIIASAFFF